MNSKFNERLNENSMLGGQGGIKGNLRPGHSVNLAPPFHRLVFLRAAVGAPSQ